MITSTSRRQRLHLSALPQALAGRVVTPGHDRWDEARSAWNLTADQHPEAVAYVDNAEQVVAAVAHARDNGLRVSAQGTGHGAGGAGPFEGRLLIKTERMQGIRIDPITRTGRFEAGVIWRDAAGAAAEHGLAVLSGSSPDVGVVGYSTGGGFGWLGRRYGLAVNSIRAIEVVTADARLRRVDAGNDRDLFWALRGAGGNFGVVTAIEFDLIDLPEVYAGSVIYPADERATDIFRSYREWTRGVPDKVTSIARFLHLPPEPDVPEPLRGKPVITLGATYAGPAAEGAEIIEPLRRLGEPVMDTFRAMPPSGLVDVHMEPEQPVPVLAETASLAEAPGEAFDAFVRAAGPGSGSPLVVAELRHAGGALAVPPSGAGARSHLDGEFVFLGLGIPMGPGDAAAIHGHIDSIREALRPWSADRRYFNFADRTTDPGLLYDPDTLNRLRDVKRRYDADDLFAGVHALGG